MRREEPVDGEGAHADVARCLVDSAQPLSIAIPVGDLLHVAWALKDLCYNAWSTDPRRAAAAADTLRALSATKSAHSLPHRRRLEVNALVNWTQGVARITRGQMLDAAASFDRAAVAFEQLGQPLRAAQTQVPKIAALSMLGRHAQAAECAERAQRALLAHGDLGAASKVSLNLGSLHLRREDYSSAARHYRAAAVLFARVGDREHSIMSDIGLADASTALGEFDEALRIYDRARMRAHTHGYPVLEGLVDESLALLHLARGGFSHALQGLERSRRRYEALDMPQHLAIAEKQLADAYLELRLLPEALALFDQALTKFEQLDMPDDRAWTLVQQGRAHAFLGEPQQADAALACAHDLFAAGSNDVGGAAVDLARSELSLGGDDATAALALAERAARRFENCGLIEAATRAKIVAAYALLRAGRRADAAARFEDAGDRAVHLQLLSAQVRCLTGAGLIALEDGVREAARDAFESAVEMFEDQRRALPGDDIQRAFLTDHLRPYHELLRMALDDATRTGTTHDASDVLLNLERFRARALGDRVEQQGRSDDPPPVVALRARLDWLYRRRRRLDDEGSGSAPLTLEIARIERDLLEHARRQRMHMPTEPTRRWSQDAFDVGALQSALRSTDVLVEYGVVDDELFACVVTSTQVTVQRHVAQWPDVVEALARARFQIETFRHGAAPVQRHLEILNDRLKARLARVHALVWAPLAELVGPRRRVLVVPHGELASVPFAALFDGERFLEQRHDIAVAPSARLALRGLACGPAHAVRVLAVGESTRLTYAAREAQFTAGLFAHATALVDDEATVEAIREHACNAHVLHFACHAHFRADNPMFSALQLHDGDLTAESIESLRLLPGTVVLSACETALAQHGPGDEMVGLIRAFLVGGAARVVATLWRIDDAATQRFMMHFYPALRAGRSIAAALSVARAAVRREHPHPFYWAGFTLHGGW